MPAAWAIDGVGQRRTTQFVFFTRTSLCTGFHQCFSYSAIRSCGTSAISVMLWLPRTPMYACTPFIRIRSTSPRNFICSSLAVWYSARRTGCWYVETSGTPPASATTRISSAVKSAGCRTPR